VHFKENIQRKKHNICCTNLCWCRIVNILYLMTS